jgi:hypothetical protein
VSFDDDKTQRPSLLDFRLHGQWQPDKFTFDRLLSLMKRMSNVRRTSLTFYGDTSREAILGSAYVDIDRWRQLCQQLPDLVHLECLIKCACGPSSTRPLDFLRIIADASTADRSVDLRLVSHNEADCSANTGVSTDDNGRCLSRTSSIGLVSADCGARRARTAANVGLATRPEVVAQSRTDLVQ